MRFTPRFAPEYLQLPEVAMRRTVSIPAVLLFTLLIISSAFFFSCGKKTTGSEDVSVALGFETKGTMENTTDTEPVTATEDTESAAIPYDDTTATPDTEEAVSTEPDTTAQDTSSDVPLNDGTFSGCLFIGDSRTVGLSTYGGIPGADVFATVGMSVYHVLTEKVDAAGLGETTLDELLAAKSYDNIVVMLGVNELGYNLDYTKQKFADFVEHLKETVPQGTKITLCANLHITAKKSDNDEVYTNEKINSLNESIKSLADGVRTFYVDVNPLFDDASGAFSEEYAYDDYHPLGAYYTTWGEWLAGAMGLVN